MLIWKVTRRGYCVGDIKRLSGIYSGNIKFNNLIIFLSPFNRVKNIISDKKKKKKQDEEYDKYGFSFEHCLLIF